MKKVLVAGATGYLGRFLVDELKRKNYWVRVLIRKESQRKSMAQVDEVLIGEITKPKTIEGIAEDIDIIISTVGITRQKEGMSYMDVDYQGNLNLLEEAKNSDVKVFQYISAINGDKLRHLKIFEAKEKFVDALKASPIKTSIVRPNGFFSDMADFLQMANKGRVYLFGHGEFKLNPMDGYDLAKVCIDKLEEGVEECTVGGPDVLSQNEIAALALHVLNKPIRITHLPDWMRKVTIWILRTFTSSKTYGPYEFFLTAMAADNIAPCYGNKRLKQFFEKESLGE